MPESRELTFACAEDFDLDDLLGRLGRRVSVSAPEQVEFEERYYDTPLASLHAAGLLARYLETADEARVEIRAVPLDPGLELPGGGPRASLSGREDPARTLQGLASSSLPIRVVGSLVERASVHTRREQRLLSGKDLSAELRLERVEVHANGNGGPKGFRRLELRLLDGRRRSLRDLGRIVRETRSLSAEDRPAPALDPTTLLGHGRRPGRRKPRFAAGDGVGEVARACCAALLDELLEHEPGTRAGLDPERLHKMRVATRRLRATLQLFEPAFTNQRRGYLRDDLKWLAARLGAVRDLDVQILGLPARKQALRAGTDEEWRRLLRRLHERRAAARSELLAALDGDRYRTLVAAMRHSFTDERSRGRGAAQPVGPLAAKALQKRLRKLEAALRQACKAQDPEHVHAARIQAKRCRYVGERLAPLFGRRMRRSLDRLARFQDQLGEIQDGVVFGRLVAELTRELRPEDAGDDGFLLLLGRLDGYCRSRAKEVASHCREAVAEHHVAEALEDLEARRRKLARKLGSRDRGTAR
ncbi:MAG: CHAD domain-containing protein [Planctomycetota bacterium]